MIPQNQPDDADQRLTNLEIKAVYAEDLLEQLDSVIVRQQRQIDALTRQVHHLRELSRSAGSTSGDSGAVTTRDELPPHF